MINMITGLYYNMLDGLKVRNSANVTLNSGLTNRALPAFMLRWTENYGIRIK